MSQPGRALMGSLEEQVSEESGRWAAVSLHPQQVTSSEKVQERPQPPFLPPALQTAAWKLAAALGSYKSIPHSGHTPTYRSAIQADGPMLALTVHWEVRTKGEASC